MLQQHFEALMHNIFDPYLRKFVLVFFDVILVYSASMEENLEHLQLVFKLLQKNQLFSKQSKCNFVQTNIEYLGHVITREIVSTNIEAI